MCGPDINNWVRNFSILLAPFFLMVSGLAVAQGRMLDGVAAVVGDSPILFSDLKKFEDEISRVPMLAQAYRINSQQITEPVLLERLIEEKIVKIEVKALDIRITDAEIENQLSQIAKQNGLTRSQLEASLRAEKIPPDLHKESIRSQLERRDLFDRVLRRGGGISEEELRKLYYSSAPKELKIYVASLANTAAAKKSILDLKASVEKGNLPLRAAIESSKAEDAGWVPIRNLEPAVAKVIGSLGAGSIAGPITRGNQLQIFFIDAERSGSEEGFLAAKNQLMAQAQAEDFENRFNFWLESKKKELHIVVNQK